MTTEININDNSASSTLSSPASVVYSCSTSYSALHHDSVTYGNTQPDPVHVLLKALLPEVPSLNLSNVTNVNRKPLLRKLPFPKTQSQCFGPATPPHTPTPTSQSPQVPNTHTGRSLGSPQVAIAALEKSHLRTRIQESFGYRR